MKRPLVIAAVVAALAVLAFLLWPKQEPPKVTPPTIPVVLVGPTTYGADAANLACTAMRNSVIGAPLMPEPNRDATRKAMGLAGGDTQPFGNIAVVRRQYAQAFELLQRIDQEGTDRLALLPPDTPRIDFIIDRHVANLVWARTMLGTFYEQGRAPAVDYAQAGAFFRKALDTRFVDDRGCPHTAPVSDPVLLHLAGISFYGEGVPANRAEARGLLLSLGDKAQSALYLLDKDALPKTYADYLTTNFDDLAENVRNPPRTDLLSMLMDPEERDELIFGLLGRVLLGFGVVVALFVVGVGVFRAIRRKQGHADDASLYRTLFAIYDVLHGIIARFGLVVEGVIGCFLGLSILFGGFLYSGLSSGYSFIVIFGGISAVLGGIAKLVEAARVSTNPKNSLVHGAARPAVETEAQAAARGVAKTPDLHSRTFKE